MTNFTATAMTRPLQRPDEDAGRAPIGHAVCSEIGHHLSVATVKTSGGMSSEIGPTGAENRADGTVLGEPTPPFAVTGKLPRVTRASL
jgi:hypothetical protein